MMRRKHEEEIYKKDRQQKLFIDRINFNKNERKGIKMKKRYTRKQIMESIKHWKRVLKENFGVDEADITILGDDKQQGYKFGDDVMKKAVDFFGDDLEGMMKATYFVVNSFSDYFAKNSKTISSQLSKKSLDKINDSFVSLLNAINHAS